MRPAGTAKTPQRRMRASSIIRTKSTGPRRPPLAILQAAEVEDGVADELAGAVVGDVAAAVDFVEGDAAAGKNLIGGQDVGAIGVAAKGEHGRMFEKQKNVFNAALEAEVNHLGLKA